MMRARRISDFIVIGVALMVLAVLTTLRASLIAAYSMPSTYDTGVSGYAALYSLLSREGVAVDRFEQPLSGLFARHGALIVAGDNAIEVLAPQSSDHRALDAWVSAGGTLVLLGSTRPETLDLPRLADLHASLARSGCALALSSQKLLVAGDFTDGMARRCDRKAKTVLRAAGRAVAAVYARGRGSVIFVTTPSIFDNSHLALRDNAAFAYALLSGIGTIAFEERIYGHATGNSFWEVLPAPMRAAIVLACVAVLLAILGANLPFAPPHEARAVGERDSSEYVASLSRMLERGGAAREVVRRLSAQVLGVTSPLAAGDQDAQTLADEARRLRALSHPRVEDVVAAGRLFARVHKEYRA